MKAAIIGTIVMLVVLGALYVVTKEPTAASEEAPAATEQQANPAFKL